MQEIVLLGSGRVAHHLALRLSHLEGYRLTAVYSRQLEHAKALAYTAQAKQADSHENRTKLIATTDTLSVLPREADYYIYALSDGALEAVWQAMPQTKGVWLHTAGSVSLEAIARWHKRSGVLYPLQTFSKERQIDWSDMPIYIEGNDRDTLSKIHMLALALSPKVYKATTSDRGKLHLAAVLACNFTNHLIALAERYLEREGFAPKSLMPLIREMTDKLEHLTAIEAQTGPASRGDETTMRQHLALLDSQPELQDLYRTLSKSIATLSAMPSSTATLASTTTTQQNKPTSPNE